MGLRLRRLVAAGVGLLLATAACSDTGTGPGTQTVVVTPPNVLVEAGDTVRLTATLQDASRPPQQASSISWSSSDSRIATVTESGLVTGGALGGPVTITASVDAMSGRATVTVTAGDPAALSIQTQPSTTGASGAALDRQPVVQVVDALGNAVSEGGVVVTAVLVDGSGSLSNATATTDAFGRAIFSGLAIGGSLGDYRLGFDAPGLDADTSNVVTLDAAGPPASATIVTQPSPTAQSRAALPQQPVVGITDEWGNPVVGMDVTASIASGGGTLGGTTTMPTDGQGAATFTDLSITGTPGVRTLLFQAGSAEVVSESIDVSSGVPATLVIATQPSSTAKNGVPFAQQPVVQVLDEDGHPAADVTVTAAVASGGATLDGTLTVSTGANGEATFTGLSLTGPVGDHTLSFTAGDKSTESATITLGVGAPASVTIVTQPSSTAQYGVAFPQQPAVDVRDVAGNLVEGAEVQASIASGGGTLGGGTTVATDGVGRATFTDLSITGTLGTRTLGFESGTGSAISESVELTAGPPASLTVTTQPSSVVENAVPFPQQPVVTATDGGGNPSLGYDLTVVIGSGGGSVGGTTSVTTDGDGTAAFTDLAITGTVGTRTLRFTYEALGISSNTIDVVAGEPAAVVILTQPPSTAVSGVTLTGFASAQVEDVSGNPIASEDVTATIASGGGTLGGTTTVTTDENGTATFSSLSITTSSPGPRTLRFASNGEEAVSSSVHVAYGQGTYLDVQYCGTIKAQRMDVSIPDNGFSRPLPVAAYVHGGSWVSGTKDQGTLLDEVRDELLSRGYVVVSLEYRFATETTNKWPAQIEDVKCAVRHLKAEADDYGFDGVRIGVWGHSAGGHLVSMLGVTDGSEGFEGNNGYAGVSSRVEAVAALGVISDLTQGPDHPELDFLGPEKTFSTWPGPSPELTDASPITWASSDDSPFLIVHGTEDTLVDSAQAQRLFDTLDVAGANATLQLVTNGSHDFGDSGGTATPNRAELTTQIADFFDAHVRFGS